MIPAVFMIKVKRMFSYFIRGLFMGVADLIPGISGATIALISGIYEKLIENMHTLFHKNSKRLHLRGYWQNISQLEFGFLVPLGLGMGSMIILGSHIIPNLINQYPGPVFGLFLGIILSSALWLYKQVPIKERAHWIAFGLALLAGVGFAFLGEGLERTVASYPLLFLVGMAAFSAMILPGISGSYVLLIFGHYTLVLHAISSFDIMTLFVFGLGGLFGLFTMSKALHHLFERYKGIAIFSLTGLMIGAAWRPLDIVVQNSQTSPAIISSVLFFLVGIGLFWLLSFAQEVAKT